MSDRKVDYIISARDFLYGLTSGLKTVNLFPYERLSELLFHMSIAIMNENGERDE
jgi:hypothetical protein